MPTRYSGAAMRHRTSQLCLTLLALTSLALPVTAQESGVGETSTVTQADTASAPETVVNTSTGQGFPWGMLGLLGLFGLARRRAAKVVYLPAEPAASVASNTTEAHSHDDLELTEDDPETADLLPDEALEDDLESGVEVVHIAPERVRHLDAIPENRDNLTTDIT